MRRSLLGDPAQSGANQRLENQSETQAKPKLGCTSRPGKTTNWATASMPGPVKRRTPALKPGLVVLLESCVPSLVTKKSPATRVTPALANGVTITRAKLKLYAADRSAPYSTVSSVSRVAGS